MKWTWIIYILFLPTFYSVADADPFGSVSFLLAGKNLGSKTLKIS